eukprot:jgi/Botrbrau1/13251/Bobra.0199s0018.1
MHSRGPPCSSAFPMALPTAFGLPRLLRGHPSKQKKWTLGRHGTSLQRAHLEMSRHIQSHYAEILRGPRNLTLPISAGTKTAVSSLEGQRLLGESIRALREKHVEFAHQVVLRLMQRIEAARRTWERQAGRVQAVQQTCEAATDRQARLNERLVRSSNLHKNLHERLQLLSELHWSLPHTLGPAEEVFKDTELPALERLSQQLQSDVTEMKQRIAVLGNAPEDRRAGIVSGTVPPAQMRRVREALSRQADLIAESLQSLSLMEAAVEDAEF